MARATTEQFHEMVVELETSGTALPVASNIVSISAANPAVVAVAAGTGASYSTSQQITISGLTGGNVGFNGTYKITLVSTDNVTVTGLNGTLFTSPTGPLNQTNTPGMTAMPSPSTATYVWSKICGITSRTVNRTTTMQQTEIPDCADESLPNAIEKAVQAQEQTISGTGVWAAESHQTILSWWRAGARKSIRVGNTKAPTGAIIYEYGPAFLTQVNNTAEKGQKVTADLQIEFDGLPYVMIA